MAGTEPGNLPKSYSMDMSSEDLVPMLVFSESSQGSSETQFARMDCFVIFNFQFDM